LRGEDIKTSERKEKEVEMDNVQRQMRIANERTPDNPREKWEMVRKKKKGGGNQHMVQGRNPSISKKACGGMKRRRKMIRNEGNQKLCPPTQRSNQIRKEPNRESDGKRK
jgi:hypothetical protein